jgi:hypothetical protein
MQFWLARKQKTNPEGLAFGGDERIRTAVRGFADLCLATRPRRHFSEWRRKLGKEV